jgi:peptide deformylase
MTSIPPPPILEPELDPESAILQIGDPRLRDRARPVVNPRDPVMQELADRLLTMTHAAQGVGIAAPQLGYGLQMIVVASHPNARYPDAPEMIPIVMINPEIIAVSGDRELGWEGCLSVRGVRGQVERAAAVVVRYGDRTGQAQTLEASGFMARIIQHEIDHLHGILFPDHLARPKHARPTTTDGAHP